MNRRIALSLALVLLGCRKDTATTPPATSNPDAPVPAPAAEPAAAEPAPAAEPVAEAPAAEPTEPEAPAADVADGGIAKPYDDPAADLTEPKDFALVKVELKDPERKIYKDTAGKVIDWSVPTRIAFEHNGHQHAIVIKAVRAGKAGANLEIDYEMDGKEIVRSADLPAKLKNREVLSVEGGIAIAVTVANKRVAPKPAPKRDTIAKPEAKDPLSGAEKTPK